MAVCKPVTIPGMTGHVRRNTHLAAEVEFLKDILRKFQSIRDEMDLEGTNTQRNEDNSDESK